MDKINKACIIIAIFILIIACLGVAFIAIIKNKSPDIKSFDVNEYQYYINNFSVEDNLGLITDSKDLLKKVEAIWIKTYGRHVKNQKPYKIFYDKENSVWLVHGTLQSNISGGVAYILVDNNTGDVLAIWHGR